MPIYVYACKGCGEVEEHIRRFSDPPLTECEHCGGRLEKQVTAAAFHLKGGGWYKDGYASPQATGGDGSSDSGGGEGGSGTGAATDSSTSSDTTSGSKDKNKAKGKTKGKTKAKAGSSSSSSAAAK